MDKEPLTKRRRSQGLWLIQAIRDGVALGMEFTCADADAAVARGDWQHLQFLHPLIVKPNSLSQGKGVSRVDNGLELKQAIEKALDVPTDPRL
jgi:biotin carboxylase